MAENGRQSRGKGAARRRVRRCRFWAIAAESDPEAIELYVRRDDAEPFLEDVRGDDHELAGILRLEPVDLKW